MWTYSLLWALLPLFGWSQYSTEAYGTTCSYDYFINNAVDSYFLVTVVIGDFLLPLFLICYCYLRILLTFRAHQQKYGRILRRSSDGRTSEGRSNRPSLASENVDVKTPLHDKATADNNYFSSKALKAKLKTTEFRIARTVVIVVVVFCVSWTPYAVVCMIGE